MSDPLFDPPAIVCQAEDVAGLLAAATAEHEAGQQAERASLEHYRKAGESLLRAKAAAGHGQWLKVLRERCKIPQQRASEYMRLAEGWSELPPGGSFTIKEALRAIAGTCDLELEAELLALNKQLEWLTADLKSVQEKLKTAGFSLDGDNVPLPDAYRLGAILSRAQEVCQEIDLLQWLKENIHIPLKQVRKYMAFVDYCESHPSRDEQEAECQRVFDPDP